MHDNSVKEFIGLLVVIGIAITMIFGFYAIPCYLVCHSKADKQGLECEWGPIQGCMVKMPDGKWMDYDRLRYME